MRELIIDDCQRSCKDLSKQIEILSARIGVVKLEKSAIMNDVAINKEKLTESRVFLKNIEMEVKSIGQRILDLEKFVKLLSFLSN